MDDNNEPFASYTLADFLRENPKASFYPAEGILFPRGAKVPDLDDYFIESTGPSFVVLTKRALSVTE